VDRIDIFVPMSEGAIARLKERIGSDTVILGEKELYEEEIDDQSRAFDIQFAEIADDVGDSVYSNTVAIGALCRTLGIDPEDAADTLEKYFGDKDEEVIEKNVEALRRGHSEAEEKGIASEIGIDLNPDSGIGEQILISGAEAVGMGAIAGGCNFISSYPMSPSTAVLVFLSGRTGDFGILSEQAEDEIAAINMAVGAWYAGARGMVTTSGGGFALMTEGLSLAAMLETPVVVHLAQRPGPATGLPTRMEQGDLELALYSGHGEFPRIIFAPGSLEEAFRVTRKAFGLADGFQVPVIILTDQYFMDSYYNIEPFDLSGMSVEKHIVETGEDYRRYELTDSGISPRGIPGYGKGLVCTDSDEHDEEGHITEDLKLRTEMVDKRLGKLESIRAESIAPQLRGKDDYRYLAICWGSTFNIVCEAVERIGDDSISVLHFSQIYPLHEDTAGMINEAERSVVVENNATAQFSRLLESRTGAKIQGSILKYDGLSFAADTLSEELDRRLRGEE
jgi:2-oxoglutarate ferredoxin oxidoreductase subunit alpha